MFKAVHVSEIVEYYYPPSNCVTFLKHSVINVRALRWFISFVNLSAISGEVTAMDGYQTPVEILHPEFWSKDDVSDWLKRCVNEYDLSSDLPQRFVMNGLYVMFTKALRLSRPKLTLE